MTCKNHTRELLSARGDSRSDPPPVLNPGRFCFRKTTTFADFGPSEQQRLVCARQLTGSVLHRCWFTQEMAHAA